MPADRRVAISARQEAAPTSRWGRLSDGHRPGKEKSAVKKEGRADLSDRWLECFVACEVLASRLRLCASDQRLLSSGARIFYYTTLALKRQKFPGATVRSHAGLSWEMTDAFLATARKVAAGLEGSYAAGVRLRRTPLIEGARLLRVYDERGGAAVQEQAPMETPVLRGFVAAPSAGLLEAPEPLLVRLVCQFLAARVPISPVASPEDSLPVALRLLKAQLAKPLALSGQVPPREIYLYEEPLHLWLGQLVQAHPWMRSVWYG